MKLKGRALTVTRMGNLGPGQVWQTRNVSRVFSRAELVARLALVGNHSVSRKQIARESRFNSPKHIGRVIAAA